MDHKRNFQWIHALLLIMGLFCSSLLISCSGDGGGSSTAILRGSVSAGAVVTNAKLAVYDVNGKLIYQSDSAVTGNYGAFIVGINNLPRNFRVVATGGSADGQPVTANLSADCRNYDAESGTVYVNLITTLISTYLDSHSGSTLQQATTAVRSFLAIPDSVDIGDPQLYESYFSSTDFLAAASSNGGLTSYVGQLLTEIDAGGQHPFPGTPLLGNAGFWVAEKLAGGLLTYAASEGLGWGLSELGWGDTTQSRMMELLGQISKQLSDLQNQMTVMQQQLNAVDYNVVVASLGTLPSDIKNLHDRLKIYSATTDQTWRAKEKAQILSLIETKILPSENAIHNAMMGTSFAGGGLIVNWSKWVAGQHHFFNYDDSIKQSAMFDYWNYLQQMQLELIIEYRHAQSAPLAVLQAHHTVYNDNRSAQAALAPQPLNDTTLMVVPMASGDSGRGIMIYPTRTDAAMTFDDAKQVVTDLNNSKFGGWNNWQLPAYSNSAQSAEIRALFQNPYPSNRLKDWALSQGWAAATWPQWSDPYDASCWLDSPLSSILGIPARDIYRYGNYDARGGYQQVPAHLSSFVLPVRYLAQGEFYFYR